MKNETVGPSITPLPLTASRADQIFPILTKAQIERIGSYGATRAMHAGETLVEQGEATIPFFVVLSGELEAVRPACATETLITIFRAGQFSGEVNTLSGRRAMARLRARTDGDVIQVPREHVLALVQTDEELSEILMRAFILRRAELLAQGIGDVTLVGSSHSADTLRIKEFLTRNVRTQSGLIPAREGVIAVAGRSPDQFGLSRLKGAERVCGGRGQFGERPLWDFNTIAELWMAAWVDLGADMDGWKLFRRTKLRFAAWFRARGNWDLLVKEGERAHA